MNATQARRSRWSVLEDVGELVREKFIMEVDAKLERRGRAPGYRPGNQWDWRKVAGFILNNQLSIPQWVRYVVDTMPTPQVNHLYSRKTLTRYEHTAGRRLLESKLRIRSTFSAEKERAFTELSQIIESNEEGDLDKDLTREEMIGCVLCNEMITISPLFRLCWATDVKLGNTAEFFFTRAVCQYLIAPEAYDDVWGGWIPNDFKEDAKKLYQPRT